MYLAIFLGGGIGSLLRYGTGRLVNAQIKSDLPWGTIVSNILACILLGLVVYQFKDEIKPNNFWFYFLAVGLCGGYSTFSTFSMETVELAQAGSWGLVFANILISVLVCFSLLYFLFRQ